MKVVVTGSSGLIGWHAAARLHAANCTARHAGREPPHRLVLPDRAEATDPGALAPLVEDADAVLHFAGANRGSDAEVRDGNLRLAGSLADALTRVGSRAHVVYANSIHAEGASVYGAAKRKAGEILSRAATRFTDLVLPHIFGEGARPFHNSVTATLIRQLVDGAAPEVNPGGRVSLLHAGEAASIAIEAAAQGTTGRIAPEGRPMSVPALLERLSAFHRGHEDNVFPDLSDPFDRDLFNSYRAALYPRGYPKPLGLRSDPRGTLFEAVKGGGGGQCFLSWTEPGATRGDHFHLGKVERFLVLEGRATIRIRPVLRPGIWEYHVDGEEPRAVDMPTLHTHSIENTGDRPLLTLFWAHEIFDPAAPDTYADPVLEGAP